MTREEYNDFANALKNNYTIDFDKLPEFCDMAISALSTDGEYIKKADILNELGDVNMDILTDEVKEIVNGLPTYSFPDSAENKGDLISRQAALNGIAEWIADGYADSVADCSHISSLVSHLPPVENKGEWIVVADSYHEDGTMYESHWECSKCGGSRSGWGEFKFCPDCGADMRGE